MALDHLGDLQLSVNKEWDVRKSDGTITKSSFQAGRNIPINSVARDDGPICDVTLCRGITILNIDLRREASILGRPNVVARQDDNQSPESVEEETVSFDFDFESEAEDG